MAGENMAVIGHFVGLQRAAILGSLEETEDVLYELWGEIFYVGRAKAWRKRSVVSTQWQCAHVRSSVRW